MSTASVPIHRPYRTAADWLRDLGGIPLERIIFDPPPGTATEADVLRKVAEERFCELINGTLVEKGMGLYESLVAAALIQALLNFVRPRNLGSVAGEGGTIRLAPGLVRIPDVAFFSHARLRRAAREPIPTLSPELAVEVLSQSNTEAEMRRKVREYLDAGILLVWLIDPRMRTAEAYTDADRPQHVAPSGKLDGGTVLPGFEIALEELFIDLPA